MFAANDSFFAFQAYFAVSNANTSDLHVLFSMSCAWMRETYSWLKSLTKSTRFSVPMDFRLRPVDPGMSWPGVVAVGKSDATVVLAFGLPTPTQEGSRDGGVKRWNCLGTGGGTLSVSTTSAARPKICLLTTKPSIFLYIASLNSNDIFLVLDNSVSSSLLIPHQLAEPDDSM